MILGVEHIGIAVDHEKEAQHIFDIILDRKPYKSEKVESEGVNTLFYFQDQTKIELLSSLQKDDPIHKYIQKRGNGIHHIALKVKDIEIELKRLKQAGIELIHEEPKMGADHKKIAFLHPKSTAGILIELCEDV